MLFSLVLFVVLQIVGEPASIPPDVKNFKPVLSKELEFRVDDYKTAFVGRVVVYQSQDDPNEFVRVYYRQVALVSERARENNDPETGGRNRNFSNLNYHQKQETEALGRVQKEADIFAYVQWRTVRDQRTGQDIREGSFRAGLLEQHGTWTLTSGYDLFISPFSEPSKKDPNKGVTVGIKFTLGGAVHIVRVDQDDIWAEKKEEANE
ncbi:MAG: hypothetical protein WD889_00710 [Candidatus Colwellbacteria bacterium]